MAQFVFLTLFFFILNRHLLRSYYEGLVKGKSESDDLRDERILNFIKIKTGIKLKKIKLLETQATWGMMAGLPGMPYMIISKDAHRNFTSDEMQWLLLHEAGHYVLWHNIKLALLQLSFLTSGILILTKYNGLLISIFIAVVFAILSTQIARIFEYEANNYALSKMDNPKGLKNIYQKAKERYRKKGKPEDTIWHRLFNVWILDIYKDLILKAGK